MTDLEFEAGLKPIKKQVLRYARGLNLEYAEDITQETLELAWRTRHKFDPARSSLSTWVITLYHDVAQRWKRKQYNAMLNGGAIIFLSDLPSVRVDSFDDDLDSTLVVPLAVQEALSVQSTVDDRISLEQALVVLGGHREMVVRECFIGGSSYAELAEKYHYTTNGMRRYIATSLKWLRRILMEGVTLQKGKQPNNYKEVPDGQASKD